MKEKLSGSKKLTKTKSFMLTEKHITDVQFANSPSHAPSHLPHRQHQPHHRHSVRARAHSSTPMTDQTSTFTCTSKLQIKQYLSKFNIFVYESNLLSQVACHPRRPVHASDRLSTPIKQVVDIPSIANFKKAKNGVNLNSKTNIQFANSPSHVPSHSCHRQHQPDHRHQIQFAWHPRIPVCTRKCM